MITAITTKIANWRFDRFMRNFSKSIKRYDAMMRSSGIGRKQRRRWKKQLISAYEITPAKLFARMDNKKKRGVV